jgi:hypothetical protein
VARLEVTLTHIALQVLIELSQFYAASFADMLNVAAFTCTEALGSSVNTAELCKTRGIDLQARAPRLLCSACSGAAGVSYCCCLRWLLMRPMRTQRAARPACRRGAAAALVPPCRMLACAALMCAPLPAQVGKLDANFEFTKDKARARVNHLPGPFNEMPFWLNFWLNDLNGVAEDGFKFLPGEALALMGSHTLIDNQACTTDGRTNGAVDKQQIDKPKCSPDGQQRMFKWDNRCAHDPSLRRASPPLESVFCIVLPVAASAGIRHRSQVCRELEMRPCAEGAHPI